LFHSWLWDLQFLIGVSFWRIQNGTSFLASIKNLGVMTLFPSKYYPICT
jgi:hypothetical protein